MIRMLILILSIFISTYSYAQITYEKGYFINSEGVKVDCLIKNSGWDFNPDSFKYKTSENGDVMTGEASGIKEFGFENGVRYKGAFVEIDLSSDQTDRLTSNRVPEFTKKQLFLKELVGGESPLYIYKDGNVTRFFYLLKDNTIKPLVYKRYYVSESKIRAYQRFKQQLLNHIECGDITENDIKSLKYTILSLTNIFREYNKCLNSNIDFENSLRNKTQINFSVKPGVQYGNIEYKTDPSAFSNEESFNFGSTFGFRLGAEVEFILPFNKNKWGIFLEPAYQSYKSKNPSENFSITYKSIEIPLSMRHYFFINDFSIFINAGGIYDIPFNSIINENTEISSSVNLLYGIGFSFKEKYSLELRRNTVRELLSSYSGVSGDYTVNFAVILGIRL